MPMSKKKSPSAVITRKEELICADKIKINTSREVCKVTGSAIVLSVLTADREIDIHLTDVEFIKLQEKLSQLKLSPGQQIAHK